MIFTLIMALFYLFFQILFLRAVRHDTSSSKDKQPKHRQQPIRFTLAYFIGIGITAGLLYLVITTAVDTVLLPSHYLENLRQASKRQVKPLNGRPTMITAHRGLSWQYPENTLIAFNAAIAHQPDYCFKKGTISTSYI